MNQLELNWYSLRELALTIDTNGKEGRDSSFLSTYVTYYF